MIKLPHNAAKTRENGIQAHKYIVAKFGIERVTPITFGIGYEVTTNPKLTFYVGTFGFFDKRSKLFAGTDFIADILRVKCGLRFKSKSAEFKSLDGNPLYIWGVTYTVYAPLIDADYKFS